MTDEQPTCDLCGGPGFARYLHDRGEWIDVCEAHRPSGIGGLRGYHTVYHSQYPAESHSAVQRPNAFVRGGGDA